MTMTDTLGPGRRNPYPFTQTPQWVTFSKVSHAAKELYAILNTHVNWERGDRVVWPGRPALADFMGFSKISSVDRYVRELVELGAIGVKPWRDERNGLTHNRYVVHEVPPEGYTGPLSLAEAYADYKQRTGKNADQPLPPKKGPGGATPSPQTGTSPSPRSGDPSPQTGATLAPRKGPELHEEKPHEVNKKEEERTVGESSSFANAHSEDSPTAANSQNSDQDLDSKNHEPLTLDGGPEPGKALVVTDSADAVNLDAVADEVARCWLDHMTEVGTPPAGQPYWPLRKVTRAHLDQGYAASEILTALGEIYRRDQDQVPKMNQVSRELVRVRRNATVVASADHVKQGDAVLVWWERERGALLNGLRERTQSMIVDAISRGYTQRQVAEALRLCGEPAPQQWRFQLALVGKPSGEDAKLDHMGAKHSRRERQRARMADLQARMEATGASDPARVITGEVER